MFSLQKLFGKGDRFLELLEMSAEEARESAQALRSYLASPPVNRTLHDFICTRQKENRVYDEINEALASSFETGIDREDIGALSLILYRIPKGIEKIAERIETAPGMIEGVSLERQLTMMDRATVVLVEMVQSLRRGMRVEQVRQLNTQLQTIEGDADKLMLEVLRDLYNGKQEQVSVIYLKDLYELIEKVFDRCRDAGNVITQIVLKNS